MLATPHATVGAAIGVASGDPLLGFVLGFVSHFLGDCLPHTEATTFYGKSRHYWRQRLIILAIDGTVMVAVLAPLLWNHPQRGVALWGFLGGIGPDLVTNIPFLGDRLKPYWGFRHFNAFHHWAHHNIPRDKWPLGVVTQVVVLCVTVSYLLLTH